MNYMSHDTFSVSQLTPIFILELLIIFLHGVTKTPMTINLPKSTRIRNYDTILQKEMYKRYLILVDLCNLNKVKLIMWFSIPITETMENDHARH